MILICKSFTLVRHKQAKNYGAFARLITLASFLFPDPELGLCMQTRLLLGVPCAFVFEQSSSVFVALNVLSSISLMPPKKILRLDSSQRTLSTFFNTTAEQNRDTVSENDRETDETDGSCIGVKASGVNEPMKNERKTEAVLREPSPYSVSKSPIPRSLSTTKPSPEGKSPQQLASGAGSHLKMMRAPDDSSQEDSEIVIVKEDPVAFGSSKDKMLLTEKERGRRDIRDSATELNFRSQEHLSAEQLRKYQYHQQMLHFYLAYNSAAQAQLLSNMPPEQQMLYQQMLFEQEKQGMRSSSSSGHTETRTFEKKETQKPSDRTQDERRSDEVSIKKAMPARTSPDESEFRRFPGKSESLPYPSSHGSSPKMTQHKLSSDEPPEKKSRVDEAYEREREMERLKYEKEEEYLQMQKQKQRMSMFKKLENEMGGTFHKQQKTPEGSERRGNLSREEEKMENRSESGRDMVKHRSQEPSTSTAKEINHSFEAENSRSGSSSDHGSPRSQVVKSQSLLAPRSPRPSRSPLPAARYKENSPTSDEKRESANSHSTNFTPTQFQAYLSQFNFDPSAGQLPYSAHQMLISQQLPLPPGMVMSMPISSNGESSAVMSSSRERDTRSPYQVAERDRSSTPTLHSSSQARMSTTDTHERLQKLKESTEKEARHSSVPSKDDRVRNRGTSSEQKISPKASSRSSDFKGESNSLHNHPSIIANNLAISRMAGHVDVLTEEEIMRRQRLAADHMGFYGLIGQFDPAFAPSMIQSSPQHMSRGVEHYMTKRH